MLGTLRAVGIASALALAACSGGGGGGNSSPLPIGGYNGSCDPGTAVSLANPTPNSYGVPSNIGSVTIVASGNNNTLYSTYSGWSLFLQSGYGNSIYGGSLSLVSDPSGPHPYASDFYYQSSVPGLQPGQTYTVILSNSNCNGVAVGQFST
jgi:hypothetical protein